MVISYFKSTIIFRTYNSDTKVRHCRMCIFILQTAMHKAKYVTIDMDFNLAALCIYTCLKIVLPYMKRLPLNRQILVFELKSVLHPNNTFKIVFWKDPINSIHYVQYSDVYTFTHWHIKILDGFKIYKVGKRSESGFWVIIHHQL